MEERKEGVHRERNSAVKSREITLQVLNRLFGGVDVCLFRVMKVMNRLFGVVDMFNRFLDMFNRLYSRTCVPGPRDGDARHTNSALDSSTRF